MAASRSMLEALLARVQKRAREPRAAAVHIPPLPVPNVAEADHDSGDTLPPQIAAARAGSAPAEALEPRRVDGSGFDEHQVSPRTQPPPLHAAPAHSLELEEVEDDDIEEYDEELIEIIDDADVIPQAAAAARAIEPGAFGANLERRGGAPNGKSSGPPPLVAPPAAAPAPAPPVSVAAAPRAPTAPPAHLGELQRPEPLRAELVAARPVASGSVVHARGVRRELRSTPFIELLDASLKLGS